MNAVSVMDYVGNVRTGLGAGQVLRMRIMDAELKYRL